MCITIFFIFVFIRYNLCDESNESKYIDLLPEEEKEQFLQKIARRIFEETEVTDEKYKHSREVTEDQLNEHTEFVEKILREESENLRKHTEHEEERQDQSEESIKVKPLVKDKISEERAQDENRYVDLTLRQGKRMKRRNSFDTDLEQNTERLINEDVKYDTEENKVIENGEKDSPLAEIQRHDDSKELGNKRDQSSFEDIQVKYFNRKNDVDNKNFDEILLSTNEPRITQMMNFDTESMEHLSKEVTTVKQQTGDDNKIEDIEPITTNSSIKQYVETSPRTDSLYEPTTRNGNESKSKSAAEEIILKSTERASNVEVNISLNSVEVKKLNITKEALRSESHNDSTTEKDSEIYESKVNIEENVSPIHEYTTKTPYVETKSSINSHALNNSYPSDFDEKFIDFIINNTMAYDTTRIVYTPYPTNIFVRNVSITSEGANHININNTVGNDTESTNISGTEISIVTEVATTNNYQSNNIVKKIDLESNINKNQTSTDIGGNKIELPTTKTTEGDSFIKVAPDDLVKLLRQRLLQYDEQSTSDESLGNQEKNKQDESQNINKQSYNVYELPPNQQPFVIKHEIGKPKNQDQPHYVPIYNYSHNNAYFNALNRYGPNLDASLEEKDSDTDYHRMEGGEDISLSKESYGMLNEKVDNRKFRFGNIDNNPKRTHKVSKIMMPVVKQQQYHPEVLINPDDYLDTDYYYGRTSVHLRDGKRGRSNIIPHSHEDTHPSLDTIKDHIRSVRKILFQNQIFGFVPPVNNSAGVTPPAKPVKVTGAPPFNNLKRSNNKNNLALDYYFERMKLKGEHKSKKKDTKAGYIRCNNYIQDIHITKDVPEDLMRKVNVIKLGNKLFFRDDKIVPSLRNSTKIFSQDDSTEYYDTIKKVLKLTNEVDLVPTLEKMRDMNLPYTRSRYVPKDLSVYLDVLNDMFKTDTKPLAQYDWLGSTVEIQSALTRLLDITEAVQDKIVIHPADFGLLKYVVYLFQTAKTMIFLETQDDNILRMGVMLPRNRNRKPMYLKEKGLLNRVWLFKRENMIESGVLNEFEEFLRDMQTALFDLHDAIKHISLITKYTDQAWFENLQRIYMKNDKKHLLEIILHLAATRLYGLIEESAVNGVEMNTVDYIRNNDKNIERSIDEYIFVLRLLDEIKYLEK